MPKLNEMARATSRSALSTSITMDVSPEMMATLEQLSHDSKQPLKVVVTRAIALYRAALNATAEGRHVGYATSPDALEVEFIGLTVSEQS